MSRVLVTGAGGFTGRHMAAELRSCGYAPVGLLSSSRNAPPPGYTSGVVADLLDASALQTAVAEARPDLVIHLAGQAFVAHGDAENVYRTNLVGTRNLLAALCTLQRPPAMTLLASSANVYGNAPVEVIDETVPASPANDYAVSKLAMEYMARLFADRLPLVIARPFNYTGVGQSTQFLIPKIVDHALRKADVIELGNIDVARDFSDVRTVVAAYRRLIETPASAGGIFNVCSGQARTLREVLDMVQELSGHSMDVRVNPAFVRANEIRILRGSRAHLDSVAGPILGIALRDTLQWMLSESASPA